MHITYEDSTAFYNDIEAFPQLSEYYIFRVTYPAPEINAKNCASDREVYTMT